VRYPAALRFISEEVLFGKVVMASQHGQMMRAATQTRKAQRNYFVTTGHFT
jgi:hypothetical protein